MELKTKSTVLVVEDQPEIARLMTRALSPYHTVQCARGVLEGFDILKREPVDLILLDITLPGLSGLELCRRIKSDRLLRHTPVIFVTALGNLEDKVNGLRLGADDYLSKPFDMEELIARVDAALRRNKLGLEANPLTKLPGNGAIETEIARNIEAEETFGVLYADINEFKAYNDFYGFHRGDDVISKTARILLEAVPPEKNLVAHLGGDDFIIVTKDLDLDEMCKTILKRFDEAAPLFYDPKDREAGFITTRDRRGETRVFPLLSLAIGVVTNTIRPLRSVGEVATIGSEVKSVAKRQKGSAYFIDRRTDSYAAPQNQATISKEAIIL